MGKLVFSAIESLDGFVADEHGRFDWAEPDESVHSFVNELERDVGLYLYGRRMYEVMAAWETLGLTGVEPTYVDDYAGIWRAADKIVYSTTLTDVTTAKTRLERQFDPEAIRQMKADQPGAISIGGPTLAAEAIRAGLVDEFQFFVAPVVIGSGLRSLPPDVRLDLELVDERRFWNGVVYLNYRRR